MGVSRIALMPSTKYTYRILSANANSTHAAFWCAVDVIRNSDILEEIRKEVESCIVSQIESDIEWDTSRLLRQPVLQAAYAETLRLRAHGMIIRHTGNKNLAVNEWTIPSNKLVVVSSTAAHMNEEVWSSAQRGGYSTQEFKPQRFIKCDEKSGRKEFTMDGTQGSWMPFGGGIHACPGRHFVKLEILLTLALLVTRFDIDIMAGEEDLAMSPAHFGFGVLGSAGKVKARVKRRKVIRN